MDPPVLSFYGARPVPLPPRFARIKQSLVAGHEAQLEASWTRLLRALRDEVDNIQRLGPSLAPSIGFSDIDDASKTAAFARDLKRYGVGVVRGVMPKPDADAYIADTMTYLESEKDTSPHFPEDPTCFDFFWTPAQVRARAHPNVLRAQGFAMSLWNNQASDRMAARLPISYADRLRIHGVQFGPKGDGAANSESNSGTSTPAANSNGIVGANPTATAAAAMELDEDFSSSALIAQIDNGSLERWEPDGYGRGGTYDAIFKGDWESYDPWDPTGRIGTTSDLYNGHGVCSIFRMFQGILALGAVELGMVRLLPSPKLATAYFLLRPFFSPKTNAPAKQRDGPEWEAFLEPSNWALDGEQSTIIYGAVPGHAQRLTELWHPHLHLRRTLVTMPTLQTGDYILWHPDLAYHITSGGSIAPSRAATPAAPPDGAGTGAGAPKVSLMAYVPAAPLTQNNALYLARQRKAFQRGHPGPDFDATGSGLGSEASQAERPGERDIAAAGGAAGLRAMGLAPFDVPVVAPGGGAGSEAEAAAAAGPAPSLSHTEAEVASMANVILFPDRFAFYTPRRRSGAALAAGVAEKKRKV